MKREVIIIQCGTEAKPVLQQVNALVYKGLAIDKRYKDTYYVTHIKSGYKLQELAGLPYKQAREYLLQLGDTLDWTQEKDIILKDARTLKELLIESYCRAINQAGASKDEREESNG